MSNEFMQCVRQIRDAPLDRLQDRSFLTDLICQGGLVRNKHVDENVEKVYGTYAEHARTHGMFWQKPDELAWAMSSLAMLWKANKFESFCEIGVWRGGTFMFLVALLSRFGLKRAWAIDRYAGTEQAPFGYRWRLMKFDQVDEFRKMYPEVVYMIGTAADIGGTSFDVVFIDGDHSEEGIVTDWFYLGQYAKWIMLHDIYDQKYGRSVAEFWRDLKKKYCQHFEFSTKPVDRMGIGLMRVYE